MDLVDEEHLALAEICQDGGEVARLLEHGTGGGADGSAEFVADHVGERRLAETRRAVEQHVVECLTALKGRGNRHMQVFAHAVLPDVIVEHPRTEARLVLRVFLDLGGRDESVVHVLPGQFAKRLPQRLLEVAGLRP